LRREGGAAAEQRDLLRIAGMAAAEGFAGDPIARQQVHIVDEGLLQIVERRWRDADLRELAEVGAAQRVGRAGTAHRADDLIGWLPGAATLDDVFELHRRLGGAAAEQQRNRAGQQPQESLRGILFVASACSGNAWMRMIRLWLCS
jgi:hypothetical protein